MESRLSIPPSADPPGGWKTASDRCAARMLLLLAFTFFSSAVFGVTLTVSVGSRSGALKKAGLGSLFGIVTNNVGAWKYFMTNSFLYVSEHQTRIGEGASIPCGTTGVAPVIRGSQIKMMCRFGDLCYGWAPYAWPGLNNSWLGAGATYSWLAQVTNACNDIKNNYSDVVYAIAIFNEPEDELTDTNFFNDPNIAGSTQPQRLNYVWAQTCKVIRTLVPGIKIMGPNYEDYRPQYYSSQATLMHDFLTNAIATATVPDIIGWHNLNADPIAPGDIGTALNSYYRPLETSLGVPGAPLPVSIEEFGVNNGAFEGIPGQMAPYWAEFERDGIAFGDMGIYENGGDLGNSMRYTMWDTNPAPNAGWYMMNWYQQMQGQYVPVTAPGNGLDGVASWNPTNQTVTILLGGHDSDATVQVNGLGALGLGNIVRVRLDLANWTTNSNVADTGIACGGDPQTGGYNLFDNNFILDGSGNLAIPVNAVEGIYNGYRVLITASNAPAMYPTKYEAENATVNNSIIYHTAQASGSAYVGGINYTNSYVSFHVTAPSNGLYNLFIRYAASSAYGPATHFLTVNGQSQGVVNYPPTSGWSSVEQRTTSRVVALVQGMNNVMLGYATNYAELDFIDVRPAMHRYDAELAGVSDASLYSFNSCYIPDCVGAINNADSQVNFTVYAPAAGAYDLSVAYGNGLGAATFLLTNNGVGEGSVPLPATGGWIGGGWLSGSNPNSTEQISTVSVNLNAGFNRLQLSKGVNYGQLDYVNLVPVSLAPAAAYAFEGNVLDRSGSGNDGTVNGTLTYSTGKIGAYAAQFNGANSWVAIPLSIGTVDFTIAMWIKTTDTFGSSGDQWYADHGLVDGEIPTVVNDFGTALGGGCFKLGIGNPDTTLTSTKTINDGAWHHVAATWSAGSGAMQIFVDGVLNVSGTGPTGPRNAVVNGLHIGNSHDGGNYFNGLLDEVELYNRILGPTEIAALAGTTAPGLPTGLIAVGGNGQVALSWTCSAGATNYVIKRSAKSGAETSVANSSATSYTDSGLATGTTYYYVVAAANAAGVTGNSSEVSAATAVFAPLQMGASLSLGGSRLALTWPGWASNYSAYEATNLLSTNWSLVTNSTQYTNGTFLLSLPTNSRQQFFRLSNP